MLGPWPPTWETQEKHLALSWAILGRFSHLGSKPMDGESFALSLYFFSLPLFLYNSNFQVNKYMF